MLTSPAIYFDSKNISRDEKLVWFAKLNPNGRSPVLIDHGQNDHTVWESTAILIYLAQVYDKEHTLWPRSIFEQSHVNQWMLLQASGQGPIIGQAFWFGYWHHEVLPSAYKRYVDETKRILKVLEEWLHRRQWLVGEAMTIADISFLSWYEEAYLVDTDIEKEFPAVERWLSSMKMIPEVFEGSKGREMITPKKIWERNEAKVIL
jgi:glutathione S-transferase